MKPVVNGQRSSGPKGDGSNWILIAGGALISTLSIRLGYKLRQIQETKLTDKTASVVKGAGSLVETKQQYNRASFTEPEGALPLVTVPAGEFSKENGATWSSSSEHLELPQKPFPRSNSFDSPSVSESGSEIFSKREVIQKLRQQLKRRDEMILEMQEQIVELQNSLNAQISHSSHLQSLLDASNRELFDSEREIQRLRKAIADHCLGQVGSCEKPPSIPAWTAGGRNGNGNGHVEVDGYSESSEKSKGEGEKIEMLKREVADLKEVIEGKEYLLQNYKEQKSELSMKIKEMQHRLDAQLPNIL